MLMLWVKNNKLLEWSEHDCLLYSKVGVVVGGFIDEPRRKSRGRVSALSPPHPKIVVNTPISNKLIERDIAISVGSEAGTPSAQPHLRLTGGGDRLSFCYHPLPFLPYCE